MAFEIEVRPIALFDIDKAINWYDQELKGLGYRFLSKVDETFERISRNPYSFMVVHEPVRRALLKSFPYKVLYFVRDERTIVIIGIIHIRRSKRYTKKRSKV